MFGGRPSLANDHRRNRDATDPINAALNYCYSVAESECRRVLLVHGLDPALGVLHADRPGRDSLALDLLETLRPAVDRTVIECLGIGGRNGICVSKRWFRETHTGQVLLKAPLSHMLAEHVLEWGEVGEPHARHMLDVFTAISERRVSDQYAVTSGDSTGGPETTAQRHRHAQTTAASSGKDANGASFTIPEELLTRLLRILNSTPAIPRRTGRRRIDDGTVVIGLWFRLSGRSVPSQAGVGRTTIDKRVNEWKRSGMWPELRAALESATNP